MIPFSRWLIPASAGSTSGGSIKIDTPQAHPRIRGEHRPGPEQRRVGMGSSPHPRGARVGWPRRSAATGLIPASAGSTRALSAPTPARRAHPRIRGEHDDNNLCEQYDRGSSPHPRGAQRHRGKSEIDWGLIPASAGSTEGAEALHVSRVAHPRIRGEHADCPAHAAARGGSSPHPRGALVRW